LKSGDICLFYSLNSIFKTTAVAIFKAVVHFRDCIFRENATLCVSPFAIVDDGCRRFRRRREKMFNADYLANSIKFLRNFLQASFGQCVENSVKI
jgi:hypothetical protein